MKKVLIVVLVLAVATAVFLLKRSEEQILKENSDIEKAELLLADPDEIACEEAKKEKVLDSWESYIEKFPHGKCADKARSLFAKADEKACEKAKVKSTRADWEFYLKDFPNGKCAEEGKTVRKKFKKIDGFEWSDMSNSSIHWITADSYCKNLEEDGHSDWRLPNIDELRTLVQNHPGTVVGGKCRISEEYNKLDKKDYKDECNGIDNGNFSKLGDEKQLWSSSLPVISDGEDGEYYDYYDYEKPVAWGIHFGKGEIQLLPDRMTASVRCVRQDEQDACETAKKYNKPNCWLFYFGNFQNSECDAKAKAVWENEDKKACKTARKENTRASWESYLKIFPKGKCAEEGNAVRNKYKKIDGFEWSDMSDEALESSDAKDYCEHLNEGGHDDWRLPDIDELRTLVQNHPGTVSGGKCKISAKEEKTDINLDMTSSCAGIDGKYFSKLGDKVSLLSSTGASVASPTNVHVHEIWYIDFETGAIDAHYYAGQSYFRCVRQDDSDACEAARKDETDESWKRYLEIFPKGMCAEEAKAGPKEEAVCERARKQNIRAAWEKYLKKFPNGKCAEEGKAVRNKFKKIGNLEWSDVSRDISCEKLEEDGHSDWRLPNIDELRTLIQNNPGTVSGGKCRISEKDGKLIDDKYWDKNCAGVEDDDNFSKLGDSDWFWSSSYASENYDYVYWTVSFDDGGLHGFRNTFFSFNTRCVRQNDHDACETARKYNKPYYWIFYFDNFPNGECAAEAKTVWENEDKKVCEEAREEKNHWYWEEYLEKFPEGKCAEEAKSRMDEICCEWSRKDNHWKYYFDRFPNGKCADEAKKNIEKMQTIGGLEWSERSGEKMNWYDAVSYCRNLKELGHTDWRLPNIDELRTLIQNCQKTESGGECKVSSKNKCLKGDCLKPERSCFCEERDDKYSKLPYNSYWLWSSSALSDSGNSAWHVDFSYAEVGDSYKVGENYVRCVR